MLSPTALFPSLILAGLVLLAGCSPPLDEQELLARAESSLLAGDLGAAELDIKTALQANPDNAAARAVYGRIYLRRLNATAAVDEFERALAVSEEPGTRLLQARALLLAGESAQVLSDFDAGVYSALAADAEFQAVLARAYLLQREPDKAREAVAQLPAGGSDYIDITRAVISLQLHGDLDSARSILEAVVERNPKEANALSLLAGLARSEGDLEAAEAYYERAATANPFRMTDRLQLVDARIELGDVEGAGAELRALEELVPDFPEVNFQRGRLYFDDQDYDTALAYLGRALAVDPNHQRALLLAANANLRARNLATAERQFAQFLSLRPGHVPAKLQLASVSWLRGEPRTTERLVREVLRDDESNRRALALLAVALAAQGLNAESVDVYQQLAKVAPDSADVLVGLGSQQMVAGDTVAGLERLEAAVAMDGRNATAHERLIEAQLVLDNLPAALAASEAYIEALPDSPRAYVFAGRVILQQEDYSGARAMFARALELEPGNRAASGGMAALAMLNDDTEAAMQAFRDSLAVFPGDPIVTLSLAPLLERAGEMDELRRVLAASAEAFPQVVEPRLALARMDLAVPDIAAAIAWLTPLEEASNDPRLHRLLARAYLADGQLVQAGAAARQLLELRPADPGALALAAQVDIADGRPEAARDTLLEAIELAPENTALRLVLIDTLTALADLPAIREQLDLLPAETLEQPRLLTLRGRLALSDGDAATARNLFAAAFEGEASSVNVNFLAGALWTLGERDEAMRRLQDWFSEHPQDAMTLNELATRNLQLGNMATAQDQYRALLELQAGNVTALNNLAWTLREEASDEALRYIERAVELAPDNYAVRDTYAMVLYERRDWDRALRMIDRALDNAPSQVPVRAELELNKAKILIGADRASEARPLLQGLVDGPGFASKAEAASLLKSIPAG